MSPRPLAGRTALVTGATRGAGRGIAIALGEAGATVFCTGRSSRHADLRSDYDRGETIEETAELVDAVGGRGIAVPCDHLDRRQVAALSAVIATEAGHLDVLANGIWGAELLKGGPAEWNTPIWEHDLEDGLRILRLGVETHLVTNHYLLPLLITRPGGLLIEVTDGTSEFNADRYRISAFYDLAKSAVNRLAFSLGHELGPYGACAVAVTPGFLRSEMMLEAFGVTEESWRDALRDRATHPRAPAAFEESESPRFIGRAIAAMAGDPGRMRWNQRSVSAAELARHYDVRDVDGRQPDPWAHVE